MDVLVANTDAPVGPLSTTRGASVSSNVVSVGRQQGDGFSRDARMRLVVDCVEIADSKVVEMVATSTGAAPEGLAPGTSVDFGSGGGRYAAWRYDQYQCAQCQYDDPQYGEAQRDGYQDAEACQYADPEDARFGQGSDDEAASATTPVAMEGDDGAVPSVERFAGASRGRVVSGRTEPRSGRIPVKVVRLGRAAGSSSCPPPGVRPSRALSVGRSLAFARHRGRLIRKTAGPAGLR